MNTKGFNIEFEGTCPYEQTWDAINETWKRHHCKEAEWQETCWVVSGMPTLKQTIRLAKNITKRCSPLEKDNKRIKFEGWFLEIRYCGKQGGGKLVLSGEIDEENGEIYWIKPATEWKEREELQHHLISKAFTENEDWDEIWDDMLDVYSKICVLKLVHPDFWEEVLALPPSLFTKRPLDKATLTPDRVPVLEETKQETAEARPSYPMRILNWIMKRPLLAKA